VAVESSPPAGAQLLRLVEVMDRLRRECPWDQAQTHASLVRYLVEETYEAVEAIETGDRAHLREELGDLLVQVVFHARIAQEHDTGAFGIDAVAAGIVEKLVRRHPHVFAAASASDGAGAPAAGAGPHDTTTADGVQRAWEEIKATEKARSSAMDGIPPGLPALSLADMVVARAAGSTGQAAASSPDVPAYDERSLGDALFSLVVTAHAGGLDAEQALRTRVRREMADVRVREQRATPRACDEPG